MKLQSGYFSDQEQLRKRAKKSAAAIVFANRCRYDARSFAMRARAARVEPERRGSACRPS
jgi:hypothetical protein